ncbi:MAG: SUMF1/EgtB/PvdO family nonheme iron enzyme, partial [Desulfobulbaceae bacterium]|nr:SUMF1/EgtB/PvdO family nonheme iron enzyme [Desulfobulbaceae bacterium]
EEELEEIAIEDEGALAAGDGGGEGITDGGSEGDGAGVGGGAFSDSKIAADGSVESGEVGGSSGVADEILTQDVEDVEIAEEELEEIAIEGGAELATGDGAGQDIALGEAEGDGGPVGDVEFEEVEIVEVDVGGERMDGVGDGFSGQPQSKLLEVLSKYLEPEDALYDSDAILVESEEGLVSQLLERFTPKFIKIPAGTYSFGGDDCLGSDHPLQKVRVDQFYLGQYPVTNDLFELFVRETGYETDAEKDGYGLVYEGQWRSAKDPSTGLASFAISRATGARRVNGANWRHPSGPGSLLEHRHSHPVVQVSHNDAQAFAAWAGKRLPTEVEWEAAARGEDGRLFPWGESWDAGRGNFGMSCLGDSTPVERYFDQGRSVFGIGDLLGNVYEWTVSTLATQSTQHFILKGGCWLSRGVISACHRKNDVEPWSNIVGFRLAVSG